MRNKILFVLHLPPPVHGAAMVGKYIQESKVINEDFQCRYINLALARSLEDIGHGGLSKLLKFLKLLVQIRKEVKDFRPDLVYVTPNACGGAFYKDFVVVQMLKLMGCRVVAHYHNKGVSTMQDRFFDDLLYKSFFKKLKVILLSEALYADVEKYVRKSDVYICPNGIPETCLVEPVSERHNPVPKLLFLSNLLVSKGILVLLDALVILKDKGYQFVCDFVGGETSEMSAGFFHNEVKIRHLETYVTYNGKKYGDDKEAFLKHADVFVFPTFYHNETFGLVVLEAMQHKIPVITTGEGGLPDIVKDGVNGYICEKQNPESLAYYTILLLDDEKLRWRMGEEGYKRYKSHYTLSAFEANFGRIMMTLVGGARTELYEVDYESNLAACLCNKMEALVCC